MKEKKVRMFDDPGIVEYRTNIEGWVGQDGKFYGKDESLARYANCTHKNCECGGVAEKGWVKCEACRRKSFLERYLSLEAVEWDGISMMCLYNDDRFFSDMDEVYEYCEDNELDISEIYLMLCEKINRISEVDIDEYNEEYSDSDGNGVCYYHPAIAEKIRELNELIRNTEPALWFESKKRIKIPASENN